MQQHSEGIKETLSETKVGYIEDNLFILYYRITLFIKDIVPDA